MKRLVYVAMSGCLLAGTASCGETPLKEQTATVARVGTRELSVQTLTELLGQSKVQLRTEEARTIVDLWIDYQLLTRAAANNDSLGEQRLLDKAIWAQVANSRAREWYQRVSKTWPLTVGDPKAMYDAGQILAVRQILLAVPQAALPMQRAAIRQGVDSLRRALTPANFAENARKYSADEGSARDGGLLSPWPARRNIMVPEFEVGVLATRPGAISGLISTSSGVHFVYRQTYAEAAAPVAALVKQLAVQQAESTYFAGLESANDVRVSADAPRLVRRIVANLATYADSTMVLATTKGGDFTAGQLVRWVSAYPPEQAMQARLANAPDTLVPKVIRDLVRNELFLKQADSAGVQLVPEEIAGYRTELRNFVLSAWGTLGIAPQMLPDSVRQLRPEAREALMAQRIDAFFSSMVAKQGLTVQIPRPLRQLLRARYPDSEMFTANLEAALDGAARVRAAADSARNANAPPAAMPALPGTPPRATGATKPKA